MKLRPITDQDVQVKHVYNGGPFGYCAQIVCDGEVIAEGYGRDGYTEAEQEAKRKLLKIGLRLTDG